MKNLLQEIRSCQVCSAELPLGPRPIVQGSPQSRILIIGQAPGTKVHETGIAWNDPSGKRLREWMDISPEQFYDPEICALMPMGFCYPGRGKSGDAAPRSECAPLWHESMLEAMPEISLTLLIGHYAQRYYLGDYRYNTLTETVRNYKDFLPQFLPLPHPSPRNNIWLKKNPWFEAEVLSIIRDKVFAMTQA